MMRRGLRFAMRLAAALASFEILAASRWLYSEDLPLTAIVGALCMPVFAWWLAAWPLALLCGIRLPGRDGRGWPVGAAGALALGVAYILYYGRKDGIFVLGGAHMVWWCVGIAGAAAVMLLRAPRLDRWLPRLMPVAVVPGAVCMALFIAIKLEGYDVPYAAAPDARPGAVAGGEQPDLLLISWDTIRADVLTAWGASGTDTPNLDRLVAEGVLFEDAVAATPITGPSHATMLTGLYPPSHGLRSNITMPIGAVEALPTLLARAGYRTGGFISAYPLLGRLGFARGFHRYDDRLNTNRWANLSLLRFRSFLWLGMLHAVVPRAPSAYTPGSKVNARALEWLAGAGDEPQFLFLHYYDAHGPFTPPDDLRAKYLARSAELQPPVHAPELAEEWALYRAEIEQVDRLLGEVLAAQEKRDPGLANTLIVLTSDHGECFGEGGVQLNHVPSLHEATQHVPLVVRFPGAEGAGRRVAETVTHLDLMPTLLAAGGVAEDPGADTGLSYPLQLVLGGGMGYEERAVYLEAQQETLQRTQSRKQGWRTGVWKLIEVETGELQLYRFREDEETNLAEEQPEQAAGLLQTLRDFFDALPKAEVSNIERSAADDAALHGLGYAGDDPPPGGQ